MRPLLAQHLEPVAAAPPAGWVYDPVAQVSRASSGEPVALRSAYETATRVAREEPDADDPLGYSTVTKVAGGDTDEVPMSGAMRTGDPVAGAVTF